MRYKDPDARGNWFATAAQSMDAEMGEALLALATAWATRMEPRLDAGEPLPQVASETHGELIKGAPEAALHSPHADVMVNFLEDCWAQYGDKLADWYHTAWNPDEA
ncbi:MAG TPA: hypothetical protein VFT59_00510 [Candidatus Saccharimonadales bacterium]|nr:hypothetical protein [Candidatus Saccharimonadales bacterium]